MAGMDECSALCPRLENEHVSRSILSLPFRCGTFSSRACKGQPAGIRAIRSPRSLLRMLIRAMSKDVGSELQCRHSASRTDRRTLAVDAARHGLAIKGVQALGFPSSV